ncbi:MAG: class I SAM-dependent methyltransferase [Proteobacteria bacterium]|nr:MAG: class I SAM-dependent methyltransferase [Pseudomonadota bacterium]QKK10578.1 MAG: methyltransferase domain-containing protein [Pseudomonadota bacterium]
MSTNNVHVLSADQQVARIFEWRRGFNAMHLIDLGVRLGLFQALAETPDASADAIAERLGLHAPYVATWCITAYSLGLVESEKTGRLRLAPHIDTILANAGHPRYLGSYVRLGTEFATEDFRGCVAAFRTGDTVPYQGRSEDFTETVTGSTQGLHVVTARKILPELPGVKALMDAGGAILDVGCGTGNFLLQLAKAFPGGRCVGVDIDPVGIAVAKRRIAAADLGDRVAAIEGPIASVQPATFDIVVMVEVLHEIEPAVRPRVVSECAQALRPGGWLVIVDETYPSTLEQARQPEYQFPLQTGFEELLWGNVVPTREEQEQLLREAGFTGPVDRSLLGEGFTLLTTRLPDQHLQT